MFRAIHLTVAVLLIGMNSFAQLSLSGTITNNLKDPIPGAQIILKDSYKGAITDSDGHFTISNLKPGTYTLQVSHLSFASKLQEIDLTKDQQIIVQMSERTLVSDEVVIRATRASQRDPISYTALTKRDLEKSNGVQDIPFLISMTPSVVQTSDAGTGIGYTGLRIRGSDASRTNVTINGIPYNDSESHDVYWVNIPDVVSSVESIQIQRGVGTSTNGAGVFGANVNIQTNQLRPDPYASVHAAGGSFNTRKVNVQAGTGLLNDQLSVDARLSSIQSDGYIDRAFANLKSWYVSTGWYKPKSLLKATVFSGKEITYQAWGGVPKDSLLTNRSYNPYNYENEVDNYQQTHYQLHWSYSLNTELNWNVALHYTQGAGYYEQFKYGQTLSDYLLDPVSIGQEIIEECDLIRRKWLDNDFFGSVFSVNYSKNKLDLTWGGGLNRYIGDHFGKVIWAQFASNGSINHEWYRSVGSKDDISTYLKANYSVSNRMYAYADIQFRHINYRLDGEDDDLRVLDQSHLYNFLNPKAGLKLLVDHNQQVFGSFGIATREPKRSNFTDASPNQQVVPENLMDAEIGYELTLNSAIFRLNGYYMFYQDQLVLTGEINDVGAAVMMNVPESYRAGIELAFAWQVIPQLEWNFNTTLSQNKILNFTEYVDDWDTGVQRTFDLGNTDLALSPSLIVNHSMVWRPLSDLGLHWDSKYVGRQYIDNTASLDRSIDPYWVNNLSIRWTRKLAEIGEVSIYGQVLNALNESYESNAWVYSYFYGSERGAMTGYYPQAGRHFLVGMRLTF